MAAVRGGESALRLHKPECSPLLLEWAACERYPVYITRSAYAVATLGVRPIQPNLRPIRAGNGGPITTSVVGANRRQRTA